MRWMTLAAIGVAGAGAFAVAAAAADIPEYWWEPGDGAPLKSSETYGNAFGQLGLHNASGDITTKGHPFFEAIGTNGRACVTCHQPAESMSVTAATIERRWNETKGKDPIFAAIDGSNCPNLPQGEKASHSLAIDRGLFRVAMPWPPKRQDGTAMEPEFSIEVVRDPTGCNTHPTYGITGEQKSVSVYRRPRMAANLKYFTAPGGGLNAKNLGMATLRDPETGLHSQMNLMSDARAVSLRAQARDAAANHLQLKGPLPEAQLKQIVDFETQVYAGQQSDRWGRQLGGAAGLPEALGPKALADGRVGVLGDNFGNPVFKSFDMWRIAEGKTARDEQEAFRASVARGWDVFFVRPFWIRDAMHINTVGLGNPTKRTCATCHNMQMTGMDLSAGWVDVGTTNVPWANESPELPLFKITCKTDVPPHLYVGRTIYTQDPGRALASGRCMDVGSIVMGQFRGLSSRAPYFSNGSAKTLRELVDFYDRRFNIKYTEQEKTDLVNFLSVL